jgi:hypothetical protein
MIHLQSGRAAQLRFPAAPTMQESTDEHRASQNSQPYPCRGFTSTGIGKRDCRKFHRLLARPTSTSPRIAQTCHEAGRWPNRRRHKARQPQHTRLVPPVPPLSSSRKSRATLLGLCKNLTPSTAPHFTVRRPSPVGEKEPAQPACHRPQYRRTTDHSVLCFGLLVAQQNRWVEGTVEAARSRRRRTAALPARGSPGARRRSGSRRIAGTARWSQP